MSGEKFKKLYEGLTPDDRKAADAAFAAVQTNRGVTGETLNKSELKSFTNLLTAEDEKEFALALRNTKKFTSVDEARKNFLRTKLGDKKAVQAYSEATTDDAKKGIVERSIFERAASENNVAFEPDEVPEYMKDNVFSTDELTKIAPVESTRKALEDSMNVMRGQALLPTSNLSMENVLMKLVTTLDKLVSEMGQGNAAPAPSSN